MRIGPEVVLWPYVNQQRAVRRAYKSNQFVD
jgi:hypothetical protein